MNERRDRRGEVKRLDPKKDAARQALRAAIKRGEVVKWPVCAVPECNRPPHAHHPDYDRPLDVVWLCPAHHSSAHALTMVSKPKQPLSDAYVCTLCKVRKPVSEFHRRSNVMRGITGDCKACANERQRQIYYRARAQKDSHEQR